MTFVIFSYKGILKDIQLKKNNALGDFLYIIVLTKLVDTEN